MELDQFHAVRLDMENTLSIGDILAHFVVECQVRQGRHATIPFACRGSEGFPERRMGMEAVFIAFLDGKNDRALGIMPEPGDFAGYVSDHARFPMDMKGIRLDILPDAPHGLGQELLLIRVHGPAGRGVVWNRIQEVPLFPHLDHDLWIRLD
ncbi:MAG TPA: hypothetical protein VK465_15075 [Fibrobacteria bacterium]|nr:hypothetical protein [Fibrobacteria bacterium]